MSQQGVTPTQGSDRPFCYRHRPDLAYQRLADEEAMQERQRVSIIHAVNMELIC